MDFPFFLSFLTGLPVFFLYPFMSGYYRGKWTYHPANISEEEQEVQKFCKETWTEEFKYGYKKWRESVGPWVE